MRLVKLCCENELAEGEIKQVEIEGREPVAVYNLNGEFFATDDTCTHGEASLSEGEIDVDSVVCPFHMGAFAIRTGEVTMPPCSTPLQTYVVSSREDGLYIEIADD